MKNINPLLCVSLGLLFALPGFADNSCQNHSRKVLSLVSSAKGPEGHFPSYPDFAEKIDLIAELDLSPENKRILAYMGYLPQGHSLDFQQRTLLKKMKLDRRQMAFIKKHRLLEINPLEYQRLTSVAPINPTYVRPGARVSVVFSESLENATVTEVEGMMVTVQLKRGREQTKNLSILKNQLFWPIAQGREVIYQRHDRDEGFVLRVIQHISEDNQVKFQTRPKEIDSTLSTRQLGLKPRLPVNTGTQDLSRPIGEFAATKLRQDFDEIVDLTKEISQMESGTLWKDRAIEGHVGSINYLTDRLQKEMRRQGISVSSIVTPKHKIKILRVEGVYANGNRPMRRFLRQFERHFGQDVVVSISDNIHRNVETYHDGKNIALGFQVTLDLLKHRYHPALHHHLRNQAFAAKRAMGQSSVFDISFDTYGSIYNLYGRVISKDTPSSKWDRFMWFEEIPIHLGDALKYAKDLKNTTRDRIKKTTPLLNTLYAIENISFNAKDIIGNILDDAGTPNKLMGRIYIERGLLQIADDKQRRVNVVLPHSLAESIEGNLSSVLASLSVSDLKDIEVILRAKLTEYEYRKKIAPQMKFLSSAPKPSAETIGNYQRKMLAGGVDLSGLNMLYDQVKWHKLRQIRHQWRDTIWAKFTRARELAQSVHSEILTIRQMLEAKTSLRKRDASKVLEKLQSLRSQVLHTQ